MRINIDQVYHCCFPVVHLLALLRLCGFLFWTILFLGVSCRNTGWEMSHPRGAEITEFTGANWAHAPLYKGRESSLWSIHRIDARRNRWEFRDPKSR